MTSDQAKLSKDIAKFIKELNLKTAEVPDAESPDISSESNIDENEDQDEDSDESEDEEVDGDLKSKPSGSGQKVEMQSSPAEIRKSPSKLVCSF